MALIHEKMIAIMKDVSAIGKDEKNQSQGFKFRGIDTVYNDLHNLFKKHEVFCLTDVLKDTTEERKTKNGGNLIYRVLTIEFSFVAIDGSLCKSKVIGEGMDSGDKASNKAMSIGHKYALLQAFLIPTDDKGKDPDYEAHPSSTKQPTPQVDKITESLGASIEDHITQINNAPISSEEKTGLIKMYNGKTDDVKEAFFKGFIALKLKGGK